jgi:hypothetical protein
VGPWWGFRRAAKAAYNVLAARLNCSKNWTMIALEQTACSGDPGRYAEYLFGGALVENADLFTTFGAYEYCNHGGSGPIE